ncbi:LYR motif-containing 4 [Chlorella sorokiniana]|uniref:LYR motif-containing 4 n=1 Tax=Chlorella sorokiniana TaxID=3076 RepID=A0A2P6U0I2_CHLSO|nr:LYR motif-containing 4 [Chlorella sorokiniana]|eukprot:PRW59819.1 LYR motif-containing 4 [Chlorella sorokiniana]
MASAAEARALYRAFLRCARHFGTSYNVKEYVRRRARQGFAEAAGVSDAAELQRLWEQGRQKLEVARRQSLVYDLYSRRHKHAMELLPKQH